jgi:hypothetical protein
MSSFFGAAVSAAGTEGGRSTVRKTLSGGRRGGPAEGRAGESSSADATSAKAGRAAQATKVAPISARIRIAGHVSSARRRGEEPGRPVRRYYLFCNLQNVIRALLKATQELSAAHPEHSEGSVQTPKATKLLAVIVLIAACAPVPTSQLPVTCGGTTGGLAGAETQLRFVEASDTQVVLTFGASSASNVFDVPAFELTPLEGTSVMRAYRLRVNGTSTRNPDGTTSYNGLKAIEPGGRTVRGVTLVDEPARVMTFTVMLERDVCPFVATRGYVYGKSPRSQIALTFGGASALTIETVSDVVGGAPIGTAVQASGAGYEPSSKITITIGGRRVWDTTANADGTFDSGFWIPDREPGVYTVTATDGHGHVGTTTLRIMAQRRVR